MVNIRTIGLVVSMLSLAACTAESAEHLEDADHEEERTAASSESALTSTSVFLDPMPIVATPILTDPTSPSPSLHPRSGPTFTNNVMRSWTCLIGTELVNPAGSCVDGSSVFDYVMPLPWCSDSEKDCKKANGNFVLDDK